MRKDIHSEIAISKFIHFSFKSFIIFIVKSVTLEYFTLLIMKYISDVLRIYVYEILRRLSKRTFLAKAFNWKEATAIILKHNNNVT